MTECRSDNVNTGTRIGNLSYFRYNPDVHAREKPYEILINLPPRTAQGLPIKRHNQEFEDHAVAFQDARGREGNFSLRQNGFCWIKWDGPQQWRDITPEMIRRLTLEQVRISYLVEAEQFLMDELNRQEGEHVDIVKVFDYRLRVYMDSVPFRGRTLDLDDGRDPLLPVPHPHIDQTPNGAILRIREHMGDRADELLKRRFRIINIWRPLKTIRNWPLAVCDATSVDSADLVENDLVRRRYIGESYYSQYNSGQRWFYLSNQQPGEVTLLKIHDSSSEATAKFALHSAFDFGLPHVGRESFEVRALVFDKP
ncbi:hypothetical protein NLG97_g4943 [Lecanicillium saksenae]|uniref:Uncharacterized protein n=1 Tax=Lecanicillium saksenae TaxID=468837 RepID=A0ACC1QTT4_9HYPO|nr:hypothetical protein NLG97_g4943 [Lecanicillium saksenae]